MRSPSRDDPGDAPRGVARPGRAKRPGVRSDRGSVAAEFAAVVPAVVVLLALCLAAVQLGSLQVRAQDAAAVAARVIARGEAGAASGAVERMLPGATLATSASGDLVCVTVRAGPGGGPFAAVRVGGTSCAPRSEP